MPHAIDGVFLVTTAVVKGVVPQMYESRENWNMPRAILPWKHINFCMAPPVLFLPVQFQNKSNLVLRSKLFAPQAWLTHVDVESKRQNNECLDHISASTKIKTAQYVHVVWNSKHYYCHHSQFPPALPRAHWSTNQLLELSKEMPSTRQGTTTSRLLKQGATPAR